MPENTTLDNIEALIDAGKAMGSPLAPVQFRHGRSTAPAVIVPQGYEVRELPLAPELPNQVNVNLDLDNVESFTEYLNTYKTAHTKLFALPATGAVLAIIDYHSPVMGPAGVNPCCHRVQLVPRRTAEWKAWIGKNGKQMSQDEFANFIEQWAPLVAYAPDPATLLELASNLEATKSVRFKSAKRMSDGNREFAYAEDVNGTIKGGTMPIPESIRLALTRCYGEDPSHLEAKLRYRINEGNLVMWFDILRLDDVEEAAMGHLIDAIKRDTGIKAYSTLNLKTVLG
jgi:uncharacterized protein YfdQ (DUF2303 family)